MNEERAKEILRLGNNWGNYSKYCTSEEYWYISKIWSKMPGYTTFHDALIRIARGEVNETENSNES